MNPLQEQFVTEAQELIQQATDDLIALEREGYASERIDRVFRAFHTLKGAAGMVELPAMGLTLHAAEDLLAAIQAERLELAPNVIDRALSCLDLVSGWVDDFASRGALPADAGEAGVRMKEKLLGLLTPNVPRGTLTSSVGKPSADQLAPWVLRLMEAARERGLVEARDMGTQVVAVTYEPRADCFFNGDDPLRTMSKVPNLLAVNIEAREPWPPAAELDPYSCNVRFQCLAATSRSELANLFRLVPDQVRIVDVVSAAFSGEKKKSENDGAFDLARSIIAEQLRMLRSAPQAKDFAGRAGSAARTASNALRHGGRTGLANEIEQAKTTAISAVDAAPLRIALDRALALVDSREPYFGELAEGTPAAESKAQKTERAAARSLRIDESKIDALGNLAGELIVLKNALAHLAKRVEDELTGQALARAVRQESDAMERLSGELHTAILELRMVPIAQVFRPFPRLVRDMAQRLGKKVTLVTEGESTEADKTIVDRLYEPLMHLVRNALDHGVETPEQRRCAGKPDVSTITLKASRIDRRFVVEVIDDGGGIDPEIIKRQALERGLLTADELSVTSDERALDLIFSAGFSTSDQISDISGRGVGMDVVRTTVQKMQGRVSVTSSVGLGTTVQLDLPANIAISRVMVVEAGGHVFGIPMDAVAETIRLTPDRISRIKNNAGFVLRDRIVPICALAEAMSLPVRPASDSATRLFVVTEVGDKIAALEIDAICDCVEVVLKPMQGLLSGARGYAGTTLLGDGQVLLVLDLKEVLA
jgi:two-component system chemotaxis sensor kinase CheA